uniref:Uncharacterized protein n=1 Tax=Aegilops tauschii TaxID=37682 RepID=M8CC75_AEGTA
MGEERRRGEVPLWPKAMGKMKRQRMDQTTRRFDSPNHEGGRTAQFSHCHKVSLSVIPAQSQPPPQAMKLSLAFTLVVIFFLNISPFEARPLGLGAHPSRHYHLSSQDRQRNIPIADKEDHLRLSLRCLAREQQRRPERPW